MKENSCQVKTVSIPRVLQVHALQSLIQTEYAHRLLKANTHADALTDTLGKARLQAAYLILALPTTSAFLWKVQTEYAHLMTEKSNADALTVISGTVRGV